MQFAIFLFKIESEIRVKISEQLGTIKAMEQESVENVFYISVKNVDLPSGSGVQLVRVREVIYP